MAAKKPVDILCMFCSQSPCSCFVAPKKTPVKRAPKKIDVVTAPVLSAPTVPEVEVPSPPKRAGLQSLPRKQAAPPPVPPKRDEDSPFNEALTCLVKAGFQPAPIGEDGKVGTFDDIKPLLNMTQTEIEISEWRYEYGTRAAAPSHPS